MLQKVESTKTTERTASAIEQAVVNAEEQAMDHIYIDTSCNSDDIEAASSPTTTITTTTATTPSTLFSPTKTAPLSSSKKQSVQQRQVTAQSSSDSRKKRDTPSTTCEQRYDAKVKFSQAVAALIGMRAILLQMSSYGTFLSVFAIQTAGTPLLVFAPTLDTHLPDLLVRNPLLIAVQRDRHHVGYQWAAILSMGNGSF